MKNATSVDKYIENAKEESHPIMNELRKIIKSTVPKAEERISWNVPNYKLNGVLAGFAVYSKHVSLGFSENGLSVEERKLFDDIGYKTGKGTVQNKFDQKVPKKAIEKTLKSHARLNAEK